MASLFEPAHRNVIPRERIATPDSTPRRNMMLESFELLLVCTMAGLQGSTNWRETLDLSLLTLLRCMGRERWRVLMFSHRPCLRGRRITHANLQGKTTLRMIMAGPTQRGGERLPLLVTLPSPALANDCSTRSTPPRLPYMNEVNQPTHGGKTRRQAEEATSFGVSLT